MKSLMKTRKQKETGEKEVHLLEQKGYERIVSYGEANGQRRQHFGVP